jgi:oligopeptide transport system permease protein
MAVVDDVISVGEITEPIKGRSPFQDAMREFRRNRMAVASSIFIAIVIFMATFAYIFTPYDSNVQNTANSRAAAFTGYIQTTDKLENCHWANTPLEWGCAFYIAGSDALGRDLWSRLVYGTRISLAVAFVGAGVSFLIGIIYGTVSGFAGGNVDNIMMRIIDFMYAVPLLPLIILLTVYFKALARSGIREGFTGFLLDLDQSMGGMLFVFVAIGALSWIGLARLARGQVLSYKQKEFVEAAHAIGATDGQIIRKHLIPNIIGPLLIAESLAIPGYIFTESALSYLGLGVSPPTPSWGAMINDGYSGFRSAPHLVLFPGAALALVTLAFNFAGDGLRDAFDPRLRGK